MNQYTVSKGYEELLRNAGINPQEALLKANLPENLFSLTSPTLTTREYYQFINSLQQLSNKESLVRIGTAENIETFSPPIFAAYCSKNAAVFFERIAKYKQLTGPLRFSIDEHPQEKTVSIEILPDETEYPIPTFLIAIEQTFLVNLMRKATKETIIPVHVTLKSPLEPSSFEDFLGIPITVGTQNKITFSQTDVYKPFIYQNQAMWDYFEPELQKRLDELEVDRSFSASVRSALTEILPGGQSSLEDVAAKLRCSKRTLQRNLQKEHTTFQQQLNHTRELLAKHYLRNTEINNDEIAYLLGYQDTNSFFRSFKVWVGLSPSEFKAAN